MKESEHDRHRWLHDDLSPDITMLYSIRRVLYSGQSKYQSIEIVDTGSFGVCLVLDGKIQSSESDEFIYHESLVHPVMLAHPAPERVFIAGGGEGATLREVLSHKSVKKAVMVDIDEQVVDVCRRFLPSFHQNSFNDPRAELLFADARKFLEDKRQEFDVIIIDLADPLEDSPSRLLYTLEFYQLVMRSLRPDGIVVVQSESAGWADLQGFVAIVNTLRHVFPIVRPYQVHIPSFVDMWGFASASRVLDLEQLTAEEVDRRISSRVSRELKAYDGLSHQSMLLFPRHIRRRIEMAERIITDSSPISVY
jgi:spermidine synthase